MEKVGAERLPGNNLKLTEFRGREKERTIRRERFVLRVNPKTMFGQKHLKTEVWHDANEKHKI